MLWIISDTGETVWRPPTKTNNSTLAGPPLALAGFQKNIGCSYEQFTAIFLVIMKEKYGNFKA